MSRGRARNDTGQRITPAAFRPFPLLLKSPPQYGSITLADTVATNTATITAVNVAHSVVLFLGQQGGAAAIQSYLGYFTLTNATTVTYARAATSLITIGKFVVLEFAPGFVNSLQDVNVTIGNAAASNTATITAVQLSKAWLILRGTDDDSGGVDSAISGGTLTNATTVTAARTGTNQTAIWHGTVLEFR